MKDVPCEVDDDEVMVTPGVTEAAVLLTEPTPGDTDKQLPHMLRHEVPVTLQTIPT